MASPVNNCLFGALAFSMPSTTFAQNKAGVGPCLWPRLTTVECIMSELGNERGTAFLSLTSLLVPRANRVPVLRRIRKMLCICPTDQCAMHPE